MAPPRCLALAAAAAALLAAGCGSTQDQETSKTVSWANGVCQSVESWQDTVASAKATLTSGSITTEKVTGAAGNVADATRALAADLRALGPPKTESGAQVQQSLRTLADQIAKGAEQIRTAIDGASAGDAAAAVASVGTTLRTMGDQVDTAVEQIDQADSAGELRSAFSTAESCKDVTGRRTA